MRAAKGGVWSRNGAEPAEERGGFAVEEADVLGAFGSLLEGEEGGHSGLGHWCLGGWEGRPGFYSGSFWSEQLPVVVVVVVVGGITITLVVVVVVVVAVVPVCPAYTSAWGWWWWGFAGGYSHLLGGFWSW